MIKTYKIAICDDDYMMANSIKRIIKSYFMSSENDVLITTYSSSEAFLKADYNIDYLFLDIEMPNMSGIELKELLQLENHKFGIIFVTSYKQYKDEAFGKNVLAYISKDKLERIHEILYKIEKEERDFNMITIVSDTINTRDIFYLEADKGYVNIVTCTKEYMFCGTLLELSGRIDNPYFVQIHRSYIVNLRYVQNRTYNNITLLHKEKLPVSRKFKDQFEQKYFEYLKEG